SLSLQPQCFGLHNRPMLGRIAGLTITIKFDAAVSDCSPCGSFAVRMNGNQADNEGSDDENCDRNCAETCSLSRKLGHRCSWRDYTRWELELFALHAW